MPAGIKIYTDLALLYFSTWADCFSLVGQHFLRKTGVVTSNFLFFFFRVWLWVGYYQSFFSCLKRLLSYFLLIFLVVKNSFSEKGKEI